MARGTDDDALAWEGDEDPTLDVRPRPDAAAVTLPAGFTAVGKGSDEVAPEESTVVETRHREDPASGGSRRATTSAAAGRPMGSATLVALGILGGVYLLYAIGWVVGGLRLQGRAQYLVTDVMFQGSFWLAVLAPILWFATVFVLTARSHAWVRFVWLAAGVALLLPWPFVLVGAVGR